ncbi:hypothetical protein C8A01DRAFT_40314, partial [Parachaetomium inaequale]
MNSHTVSIHGLTYDEKATLLDEKSASDIERDARRADLTSRFSATNQWTTITITTHAAHRALNNLPSLLRRIAIFLLPSFIQPLLTNSPPSQPPRPGPTAYLDGLRGLAALAVFFC